jgi:hypothetical protein
MKEFAQRVSIPVIEATSAKKANRRDSRRDGILLTLLLAAGCAHMPAVCASPAVTTAAPIAESLLRAKWEERFGPISPACDSALAWIVLGDTQLQSVCGANVAGCELENHGCPVAFAALGNAHDAGLFTHELAHRLASCAFGDPDPTHKNADVWGDGGWVPTMRTTVAQ